MSSNLRVFGVDYPFLSCGSVFTDGLAHAAADLGVTYAHAIWNEPNLQQQIEAFAPDLIVVVHGRYFAQRFQNLKGFNVPLAVWLLDEPYETDECASWSHLFDHVFVNDQATLHRHANASYLPVCYDPHVHYPGDLQRIRQVGFIGGGNSTRERYLGALVRNGLVDYVVGGDWADDAINAICVSRNIPPAATAMLYRQTRIVLNVFRETHHFNREQIQATSLNPRVYEALACGSLVVSEWRQEIADRVPELPTFRTADECVDLVRFYLGNPSLLADVQAACAARLASDTYANRLQTVLTTVGLAVSA